MKPRSLRPVTTFEIDNAEFAAICKLVRGAAGITLGGAKQALVVSRLSKRLRFYGYTRFSEYIDHLQTRDSNGREMLEMINCITTNKTEFFREPHHFDWLRDVLIPSARQRAASGGSKLIRIWSAGCSTGQEPYTIAMVLAEAIAEGGWDARILATDIDTNVLARAEAGVYDEDALDDVPVALRRKYFEPNGSGELVATARLRDLISFRRLNFIDATWPIKNTFDVIFCRNVTIYFDRETQEGVYARFARLLRPGGFLVAGHSENLHWLSRTFTPVGNTIYRLVNRKSKALYPPPTPPEPAPPPLPEFAIHSGGVHSSSAPSLVRTVLGSCVAACVYDPQAKVGGMNHFMLPDGCETDWVPTRFGSHAMEALIDELLGLGADRRRLQAKIFGGAHVLRGMPAARTIPDDNVTFVRTYLAEAGISVAAEKVGGDLPMLIRFETHTGRAFVRTVEGRDADLAVREEAKYRESINEVARESVAQMRAAKRTA